MRLLFGILLAMTLLTNARGDETACDQIERKCKEAGYQLNQVSDRDLTTRCFMPVINGQGVPEFKVDADTIQKCNTQLYWGPHYKPPGPSSKTSH